MATSPKSARRRRLEPSSSSSSSVHQVRRQDNESNDRCYVDYGDAVDELESGSLLMNTPPHHQPSETTNMFRKVAFLLLVGSTIVLSTVTYSLDQTKENQIFREQFRGYAELIETNFRTKFQSRMLALDALGIAVASYAEASQLEWPLVTIPDFHKLAWASRLQLESEMIGLIPLVRQSNRSRWEDYSIDNQGWVTEARLWERQKDSQSIKSRHLGGDNADSRLHFGEAASSFFTSEYNERRLESVDFSKGIANRIFSGAAGMPSLDEGKGPFAPVWQTSPVPPSLEAINYNLLSHPMLWDAIDASINTGFAVLSRSLNTEGIPSSIIGGSQLMYSKGATSGLYYPLFKNGLQDRNVVALLAAEISWTTLFAFALPRTARGVYCVIKNACGQSFTYEINGGSVHYVGADDYHDHEFDDLVETRHMAFLTQAFTDYAGTTLDTTHCPFTLHVYPSKRMQDDFVSMRPVVHASIVVALFFVSAAIFFVYEGMDNRICTPVKDVSMSNAVQISSLKSRCAAPVRRGIVFFALKRQLWLNKILRVARVNAPWRSTARTRYTCSSTTVVFAAVDGAWDGRISEQEQKRIIDDAYHLLKTVAQRFGRMTVEVAGDCLFIVSALSLGNDDHASILTQFACDVKRHFAESVNLRSNEGVSMRFGIHSGCLQTGLRDTDSSRLQLLDDTADVAYEMLATSKGNRIQITVETAELLELAGKADWIAPRKTPILVEGIGVMTTFWVKEKMCLSTKLLNRDDTTRIEYESCTDSQSSMPDEVTPSCSANRETKFDARRRTQISDSVVDKSVSLLAHYLKRVQAFRKAKNVASKQLPGESNVGMGCPTIDEAQGAVKMAPFDAKTAVRFYTEDLVELEEEVLSELRLFVASIAATYRSIPYHNFDRAHSMATTMDRMIKDLDDPTELAALRDFSGKRRTRSAMEVASALDERSFGLASDPVCQFACVFAALVVDADHTGVPNQQLVAEESPIASMYKKRSVAEQNSVDIAWWLLMTSNFSNLRAAIYVDTTEMQRFRQIIVNTVLATDVLNLDHSAHRERAWNRVFHKQSQYIVPSEMRDGRATVICEHLMLAADFSHAMQEFGIYMEWNMKKYSEAYRAYHSQKIDQDPTATWYMVELAVFDEIVVPLATRLRDCGVLGVPGAEYLQNAQENRSTWFKLGKRIVLEMKNVIDNGAAAAQEQPVIFT